MCIIAGVGFEWPSWALYALVGIEPHEVMQVLQGARRWPRTGRGTGGLPVLTVWGRTSEGRALIVAVRQLEGWHWEIIGARDMRPGELTVFEKWERAHD